MKKQISKLNLIYEDSKLEKEMAPQNMIQDGYSGLPEFHFDLLARILPGLFTIFVLSGVDDLQQVSLSTVAVIFLLAYPLGLLIDAFADYTIEFPISLIFKKVGSKSIRDLWAGVEESPPPKRKVMLKILGERSLFRSLMFVSLVFVFIDLPPVLGVKLAEPWKVALPFLFVIPLIHYHRIAVNNLIYFVVAPELSPEDAQDD